MTDPAHESPAEPTTATDDEAGVPELAAADADGDDVEPAFAMDLDPEDQGTAEAAAESSG